MTRWRHAHFPRARRRRYLTVGVALGLALATAASALAQAGFMRAGSMTVGRSSFEAVPLVNGRVLVASGASVELFDPTTSSFASGPPLGADHGEGLAATRLPDGSVLVSGGQAGDSSTSAVEILSPSGDSSLATGDMTEARSFHTATLLLDGRVLVAGGHPFNHPASALLSAEIFDPSSGDSVATDSMSTVRQDHTATLLPDGRVLIAGGYDQNQTALRTAEIYDPVVGRFSSISPMVVGRGDHTATLLSDGAILLAGGHEGFPAGSTASAELFHPDTETFSPTGAMTVPRGAHTASVLADGRVLIAGGFTAFPFLGSTLSSAEIYDPASQTFTATASMHEARGRHAGAALPNGDVLVAGGIGGCCSGGTTTAEVYTASLVDTTPPVITVPGDIVTVAFSPEGAVVFFTVSALDNVDDNVEATCQPSSGSIFPIGSTTVTCSASDSAGNSSTRSFTVSVLQPLDIGVDLASAGKVDPRTGVATVSGAVSCNRDTTIFLSGQLTQLVANRASLTGTYSAQVACTPPSTTWQATSTADNGRFKAGMANATIFAGACDQLGSCDFAQPPAASILLRGKL